MKIINERDGSAIADVVEMALSLGQKVIGLIGRTAMSEGSAFVIPGCRQVHTCFMRFSIDVVFVDGDNVVVCIEERLRPFQVSGRCVPADRVIELPAGAARNVRIGDKLSFVQ